MIFDKTKMVKNQELQIEALTTQVQSLKDINLITKDLLEIRNSEVKAMEVRGTVLGIIMWHFVSLRLANTIVQMAVTSLC
jgi:hypothetical protein